MRQVLREWDKVLSWFKMQVYHHPGMVSPTDPETTATEKLAAPPQEEGTWHTGPHGEAPGLWAGAEGVGETWPRACVVGGGQGDRESRPRAGRSE